MSARILEFTRNGQRAQLRVTGSIERRERGRDATT
jgi:hypothetical protein